LQLERQVVVEISDAGRIHRQLSDIPNTVAFSGGSRDKPADDSSVDAIEQRSKLMGNR
jgi:hypothetical protein